MVRGVLIFGGALTLAIFMLITLSGTDSDDDGRIAMPGEAALRLDSGKYGLYYEDAVETGENETFEPPDRYGFLVGRPPRRAPEPTITVGEDATGSVLHGAKLAGIAAAATALLAGLVLLGRRLSGRT